MVNVQKTSRLRPCALRQRFYFHLIQKTQSKHCKTLTTLHKLLDLQRLKEKNPNDTLLKFYNKIKIKFINQLQILFLIEQFEEFERKKTQYFFQNF
jgi:hypothetical protein